MRAAAWRCQEARRIEESGNEKDQLEVIKLRGGVQQDRAPLMWVWLIYVFSVIASIVFALGVDCETNILFVLGFQLVLVFGLILAVLEAVEAGFRAGLIFLLIVTVVVSVLAHALIYEEVGLMPSGEEDVHMPSFSDGLYFSIVTFTTLGYGDFAPVEKFRLMSALQAVYGYLFLGSLVGLAVSLASRAKSGGQKK